MKFLVRLVEKIFLATILRRFWMSLLRIFFIKERIELNKYLASNKNKKDIVAVIADFYAFEHVKDIIGCLNRHKDFFPFPVGRVGVFTSGADKNLACTQDREKDLVRGKNYFAYIWLPQVKSKIFIEPYITPYSDFCKDAVKILYAHSIASLGFSKDASHIKRAGQYDYLFLTGPMHKKAIIAAHERYGGELPEMVEVGFLKGDRLLARKNNFDRKAQLDKMNLQDKTTVLFAPTWGEFSCAMEWIDRVVSVCREYDVNILIKLHPIMVNGKTKWETGGVNWHEKLDKISETYESVRVIRDNNLDEYLLAADIAITEASSVGMEFMLLEKPVIFLPADNFFKLYGDKSPVRLPS